MRPIDKGMLLAEYFSIDTSKGVSSFIKWLKQSDIYHAFEDKMHELQHAKSLKARKLYLEAKNISVNRIKTMEEGFIVYGKINYILMISDVKYYSNPLIIEDLGVTQTTLGEIKVKFDEKMITLNDFSLSQGYSFEVKNEYIKKYLDEWTKEVNEFIVKPVKNFQNKENFLSSRHAFTKARIIQLILLAACIAFCTFTKFTKNEVLNKIASNGYGRMVGLTYYLVWMFSIIYFIEVVIIIIYKAYLYRDYRKHYKYLDVDIDNKVIKEKNHLKDYMLKQITNNSLMDAPINKFNDLSDLIIPVYYFSKRYDTGKMMKFDRLTLAEKASIISFGLLVIFFVIVLFLRMGGN
jgi:uncharacterized membrane protein